MPGIPQDYRNLFEKRTIAHVVTTNEDGSPHATPVWIDYDERSNRVLVNTERHRRKTRNVQARPDVAVSLTDPDDPYCWISITGTVEEITTDGARDHIDELAKRYKDVDSYPSQIHSERVKLLIQPQEVLTG